MKLVIYVVFLSGTAGGVAGGYIRASPEGILTSSDTSQKREMTIIGPGGTDSSNTKGIDMVRGVR